MIDKTEILPPLILKKMRKMWESSPKNTFLWLLDSMKIDRHKISVATIKQIAESEGWQKENKPRQKTNKKPKRPLSLKQQKLVKLHGIVSDNHAMEIAGYSPKTPSTLAKTESVEEAIEKQAEKDLKKLGLDRDEIIQKLANIAFFNASQLLKIKRVACRYCYSDNDQPLLTLDEYNKKVEAIEEKNRNSKNPTPIPPKPTKFYNPTLPPNEYCPNCFGEGLSRWSIENIDKLDEISSLVYKGFKLTNFGPEVMLFEKEKAWDILSKALNLANSDTNIQNNIVFNEALADKYNKIMQAARERDEKILEREKRFLEVDAEVRGIKYDGTK